MRSLCIVLDSVGCGHAPDAGNYGDAGANTLGHLLQHAGDLRLPHLFSLGLGRILGPEDPAPLRPGASFARLTARSAGKDTTTGHWELMGATLSEPFATYSSFPAEVVSAIEKEAGVSFIGNIASSGTEILERLGEEHVRSGKPILYTSADSVLQIAAHEERFGLEKLWDVCKIARNVLDARRIRIGRVIARPFTGDSASTFQRTGNRHDYSLTPPETLLNRLQRRGIQTVGVGKISDIFAASGISESHPTRSNAEGMETIRRLWEEKRPAPHFIFANLVDFDSLYGHRRDPRGYAECLMNFDAWLGPFLEKVEPGDFLLITADHGNDPYHPGTDHTREQVPALALNAPAPLRDGPFSKVAGWIDSGFR